MEELDLKEIFNMFWRKKIAIIVILILTVTIGLLYSYFGIEAKYTSYTTILLKQENIYLEIDEGVNKTNLGLFVPTYMELVKSNVVIKDAIEELNIDGLNLGSIEVSQIEDTEMVKITVTNSNPEHAAQVANKLVEVANKKIKEIYKIDNIYVIDKAEVSSSPSNINHKKDILVFTFIGIVIACGYVLLMNIIKPNNE